MTTFILGSIFGAVAWPVIRSLFERLTNGEARRQAFDAEVVEFLKVRGESYPISLVVHLEEFTEGRLRWSPWMQAQVARSLKRLRIAGAVKMNSDRSKYRLVKQDALLHIEP